MTHEEVKSAIERLRALPEKHIYTCTDVMNAICTHNWVDTLVGILQQADPDTHMGLPVDADGVPIHVGDELRGYGYPDGEMHCQAVINDSMILAGRSATAYKSWLMWSASEVHHYHKPTIEDVLRDFVNRVMSYNEDEDDGDAIISDYANRLRKLMTDE